MLMSVNEARNLATNHYGLSENTEHILSIFIKQAAAEGLFDTSFSVTHDNFGYPSDECETLAKRIVYALKKNGYVANFCEQDSQGHMVVTVSWDDND